MKIITGFLCALALLAVTTPVHANLISNLDADVALNYGANQLTGNIDFTYNQYFYVLDGVEHADYPGNSVPYNVAYANLSINGTPLTGPIIGNTGFPETQTYFETPGPLGLFDLEVYTSNIGNLNFVDFVGATSGTVIVDSETLATPLPPALPLFGTGLLGLICFAAFRMRRQSDATRQYWGKK